MSIYRYSGNVPHEFIAEALEAFEQYKSDKAELVERLRDNERFYRRSYSYSAQRLDTRMTCDTPFIFSSIENARADVVDNYPAANVLAREPEGSRTAELLSKIVPAQLELSGFKRVFKENTRAKLKFGTAVYGVFYNEVSGEIEIRAISIFDVFPDFTVEDVQDGRFLFIRSTVPNDLLKAEYPQFAELFSGDAEADRDIGSCRLRDHTAVLDCYYKKPGGTVHLMKLCRDTVIAATEDMPGYENGLYSHGLYPVVFDVLYPENYGPFGFGMIDIGKPVQVEINKLDAAITENIMCVSKPRYLAKRSGGIDEREFRDMARSIVHYEGEPDAVKPIDTSSINEYFLAHREYKKDELKEILGNRDFQQGSTVGGVTAASAIETLRQTGEKRSRSLISDTYDAYRRIVMMMLELMRQFFSEKRYFRVADDFGQKDFAGFSNDMMYTAPQRPLEFDIDVVPQKESPYARESGNNTIMSFWQGGMFAPQNLDAARVALKNMNFDGKEQLLADLSELGAAERRVNEEETD